MVDVAITPTQALHGVHCSKSKNKPTDLDHPASAKLDDASNAAINVPCIVVKGCQHLAPLFKPHSESCD